MLILWDNGKSFIDEDILLLKVIEMKKKLYLTYLNNIMFGFEFEVRKFETYTDIALVLIYPENKMHSTGKLWPHQTKVNLNYERNVEEEKHQNH